MPADILHALLCQQAGRARSPHGCHTMPRLTRAARKAQASEMRTQRAESNVNDLTLGIIHAWALGNACLGLRTRSTGRQLVQRARGACCCLNHAPLPTMWHANSHSHTCKLHLLAQRLHPLRGCLLCAVLKPTHLCALRLVCLHFVLRRVAWAYPALLANCPVGPTRAGNNTVPLIVDYWLY